MQVPDELEPILKELSKSELNSIVSKALKQESTEVLLFKVADEMLKNSKMTAEVASKLGDELKERVAKRHGL